MFKKKSAIRTTIDSLIGAGTRVEGNVVFRGGLRIDGQVRGDVIAGGDESREEAALLMIGESGRIDGNVVAVHLVVNGTVNGSITVSGALELQPKARVSGEVRYRSVEIHRGAMVEGIMSHVDGDLVRPDLKLGSPAKDVTFGSPRALPQRAP